MFRIDAEKVTFITPEGEKSFDLTLVANAWQELFLSLDDPEKFSKELESTEADLSVLTDSKGERGQVTKALLLDYPALLIAFLNGAKKLKQKFEGQPIEKATSMSIEDELMTNVLSILNQMEKAPLLYSKLSPWEVRLWIASHEFSKEDSDENRDRFRKANDRVIQEEGPGYLDYLRELQAENEDSEDNQTEE